MKDQNPVIIPVSLISTEILTERFEEVAFYPASTGGRDHHVYRNKRYGELYIARWGGYIDRPLEPISEKAAMADWINQVCPCVWQNAFMELLRAK